MAASSYNLACLRSYGVFSFLWRVRLAGLFPHTALGRSVDSTSRFDGIKETCEWYRQNWPTVLLLLPRAGLTCAVILLYNTTAYGSTTAAVTTSRDSAYFDADGTLSPFAFGVLMTNAVWAAWRLVLVVGAAFSFWLLDSTCVTRRGTAYPSSAHPSREHLTGTLSDSPVVGQTERSQSSPSRRPSAALSDWRTRRQRRLRCAILACLGSTPLSLASSRFSPSLAKSPYVLGYSSSAYADEKKEHRYDADMFEQISPDRKSARPIVDDREADFNVQAVDWEQPHEGAARQAGPPTADPRGFWSSASNYVLPHPKTKISPIISIEPATPSPSRNQAQTQTSGIDGRRASTLHAAQRRDGGVAGLHRRVRSVPVEQEQPFELQQEEVQFSPRPLPTFKSLVSQDQGVKGLDALPVRPQLVSQFSAISDRPPSNRSMPLGEMDPNQRPPARRDSSDSSFASPMPAFFTHRSSSSHRVGNTDATPSDANYSAFLRSQLARGAAEHQRLSARLLDEVNRIRHSDALSREEALREGGLYRHSRVTSTEGGESFETAEAGPPSDVAAGAGRARALSAATASSAPSQSASFGRKSGSSTVRGAVRASNPSSSPRSRTFIAPPADERESSQEEAAAQEEMGVEDDSRSDASPSSRRSGADEFSPLTHDPSRLEQNEEMHSWQRADDGGKRDGEERRDVGTEQHGEGAK